MAAVWAKQFCRIERWRGYIASSFYVRLPDGTVLESAQFRWRRTAPPPNDGSARAAYDELVVRLEDAGWTRDGNGADWFAATFVRLVEHHDEIGLQPQAEIIPAQLPPAPLSPRPLEPSHEPVDPEPPVAREPPPPERPPEVVSGRRRWPVALAAGAALLAAAGLASAALLRGHDGNGKAAVARPPTLRQAVHLQPTTTSPKVAQVTTTTATTTAAPPPASKAAKRPLVDLRIAAHGTGSWVEVRRTSATGPVLYSASLANGRTLHFRGPKLWARFGAASNLTITANGRPLRLQGTYDKLFVPRR